MSAKTIPPVVTARWLTKIGACVTQVKVFERLYPKGVRAITAAAVRKLMRFDVEVEWLARRFGLVHGTGSRCLACFPEPIALASFLRSKQRKAS